MINLNKKELKRLDEAIDAGLSEFGIELGKIILEKQVIPKKTGHLEASQKISKKGKNRIRIYYSEPYARKLYYNEEGLKIHRKNTYNYEENHHYIRNKHARDHWLEDVLYDSNNVYLLAKYIKKYSLKLKDLSEGSSKKEDFVKPASWDYMSKKDREVWKENHLKKKDKKKKGELSDSEFFGDDDY